ADRVVRDPAGRQRERHLPPPPGCALLLRRPDRPRPARRLRGPEGHRGRGGRALAAPEPRDDTGAGRVRLLIALSLLAAWTGAALGATGKDPRKVIKPAAQARAKLIAVQFDDLPGFGWKASPAQTDRSKPRCSYYHPDQSRLTENGEYTSPDFTRPDGLYVSSSVGVFVSAKQAHQSFALVARPELPRCLGESVLSSGQPGHITRRDAGKLAFPKFGDRSASYRIVFSIRNVGQQVPATIDLVAINKGAVDVAVFFSSAGQPVPASFERKITSAVVARVGR